MKRANHNCWPGFLPLVLVLQFFAFWNTPAQSFLEMSAPNSENESNSFSQSMYLESNLQCTASLRVDHVWKDYETKGFFRIGVLPMVVLKGVKFEIKQPAAATEALRTLQSWTSRRGAERLELRQVTILVNSMPANRLSVGRVHLGADGQWILRDGVTLSSGTQEIRADQGTLQVTGEKTGRLVLNTSPPVTANLITFSNESKPVEKEIQ
jgi:hypothetical protein